VRPKEHFPSPAASGAHQQSHLLSAALLEELETLADMLDESTQQERDVRERAEAAEKHASQLQTQLLALQVYRLEAYLHTLIIMGTNVSSRKQCLVGRTSGVLQCTRLSLLSQRER
jgi:hypothetical protein